MMSRKYGEYGEYGMMIKTRKTPIKERIPKPMEGYEDIKPDALPKRTLTTYEQGLVDEFVKKQTGQLLPLGIIFAIVGIMIPSAVIYSFAIGNEVLISDLIKSIVFGILFCLVPVFLYHLKKGFEKPVAGVKVGYLNGIWFMSSGAGSKGRHYYFDVKFPEDATRIKRVICNRREVYYSAKENDKILVITYDGKNAYAIKLNVAGAD